MLHFFKRLGKKGLILVCTRICDHRVTKSVGLKALPAIRVPVPVWYCAAGHVHTGDVCVGDTFSPMSRAQPPAIIFLADCCFHFYDQHKRKQKMFYREMSLWATRTGFPVSGAQDWFMSRSGCTLRLHEPRLCAR